MEDRLFGYALLVHGDIELFRRAPYSPLADEVCFVYKRALNQQCVRPVSIILPQELADCNAEIAIVVFVMCNDMTDIVKMAIREIIKQHTVLCLVQLNDYGNVLVATHVGIRALNALLAEGPGRQPAPDHRHQRRPDRAQLAWR